MRLCIDIDGTICEKRNNTSSYEGLSPIEGAIQTLNSFRRQGHYIILYTARNMETHNSNLGKVIKSQGKILLDWLEENEVPYDEIYFGKPSADVYIDDKAIKFESWKNLKF